MNAVISRIALAAVITAAAVPAAFAANPPASAVSQAVIVGAGEDRTTEYIGPRVGGFLQQPTVVIGTGETYEVVHVGPAPAAAPVTRLAVTQGTGESATTVYVSVSPRG